MLALAIDVLWLLIGVIILCGVVYLVLYGFNNFVYQIPDKLEKGIWFIILLLVVIAVITLLAGGGPKLRGPSFYGRSGVVLPLTWTVAASTQHNAGRALIL